MANKRKPEPKLLNTISSDLMNVTQKFVNNTSPFLYQNKIKESDYLKQPKKKIELSVDETSKAVNIKIRQVEDLLNVENPILRMTNMQNYPKLVEDDDPTNGSISHY